MLWACLRWHTLNYSVRGKGGGCQELPCDVHRLQDPSQDVLLRLTNRRLYIRTNVQEYLAGLDAEWEERLTRWTLGVHNALEGGTAFLLVPGGVALRREERSRRWREIR